MNDLLILLARSSRRAVAAERAPRIDVDAPIPTIATGVLVALAPPGGWTWTGGAAADAETGAVWTLSPDGALSVDSMAAYAGLGPGERRAVALAFPATRGGVSELVAVRGVAVVGVTAPAAFAPDDWSVREGPTGGAVTVRLAATPADGGSPVLSVEVSVNDGPWSPLPGGAAPGDRLLDGLAPGLPVALRLRAVNAAGAGAPSAPVAAVAGGPAAFADADWALGPRDGHERQLLVTIHALPEGPGAPVETIRFSIDGGATWADLPGGAALGQRSATAPSEAAVTMLLRGASATGEGAIGPGKTATPGVGPRVDDLAPTPPPVVSSGPVLAWANGAGDVGAVARFGGATHDAADVAARWEISRDGGASWTYVGEPPGPDGYYTGGAGLPPMNEITVTEAMLGMPGAPAPRLRARVRFYAGAQQTGAFVDAMATTAGGAAFLALGAAMAPVWTTPPAITREGRVITVSPGTATGAPAPAIAVTAISPALGALSAPWTFTVPGTGTVDVEVRVEASNIAGTLTATLTATAPAETTATPVTVTTPPTLRSSTNPVAVGSALSVAGAVHDGKSVAWRFERSMDGGATWTIVSAQTLADGFGASYTYTVVAGDRPAAGQPAARFRAFARYFSNADRTGPAVTVGPIDVLGEPGVTFLALAAPTASAVSAGIAQTVTATLGKPVSRLIVAPPDPNAKLFTLSRAGLENGTAGAHVYRVTNRNDSGAGSLADAVSSTSLDARTGPRIVVFDVAGVWALGSRLRISRPRTWVAGQTAPGPVYVRSGFKVVGTNTSNIVVEHVFVHATTVGEAPADGNCLSANATKETTAWMENQVWRQCSAIHSRDDVMLCGYKSDPAPELWYTPEAELPRPGAPGYREHYVSNLVVHDCFFGEPYAQGVATGVDNQGPSVGGRCSGALVNNVISGFLYRTPQVAQGGEAFIGGNFIHDFDNYSWNEDSQNPVFIKATASGGSSGHTVHHFYNDHNVVVVANYAEPGALSRSRRARSSGYFVPDATEPRHTFTATNGVSYSFAQGTITLHEDENYLWQHADETNVYAVALGPGGRANKRPAVDRTATNGGRRVLRAAAQLWSEVVPTHPSETRQWALDHAGALPSARPAAFARVHAATAAQQAKTRAARDRLDRQAWSDSADASPANTSGAWSEPANPFAIAANGLTNIENALHALNVTRGGTPHGNVDRPLYVPGGGKLKVVSATGAIEWTGAPVQHAPVPVTVTFADGSATTFTVATS